MTTKIVTNYVFIVKQKDIRYRLVITKLEKELSFMYDITQKLRQ